MQLVVSKMAGTQQHQQEEQQFCCSVCLDLPKEPVTINCGHSYCRSCIEGCWDQEEGKGEYSCPQCRETFSPRPVLRRNNMLAELVEKLKKTSAPPAAAVACASLADVACAGPADIACDFCCGAGQNRATMSCLTCLASYCPAHLEPHYSVPVLKKHQLVSATTPLQQKMCTKHNKMFEVYCQTDQQLVCSLCTVEEHKGHKTIPVSVQKAKTEKRLVSSQKQVQQRVQQREKELKELSQTEENLKSCAQTVLMDCDKIFSELIFSMQRRRIEVKQLISDQEKTAVAQAGQLQLQLQEEITKLRRRHTELEQLSNADDYIHMIQIFESLSTSCDSADFSPGAAPPRSFSGVTDCVSELRDKLEIVLRDAWPRISATVSYVDFSLLPTPKTRQEFLSYCCPLTLDVTSNYPYLYLICNNLRVRPSPSPYAAHSDRFTQFPQVLCREGLSERHYWELEWYARTLSAAVAYRDIDRTADESKFGNNDKSWSLECTADGYSFRHNNVETTVSGPRSSKIGVYLDYKAGILCFYHVSEPMVLLHKVQTTFTQPLYPGLGLNYEWYDVGVFAQLVKLWK
ncbi:tripartite motif-containing protein 16 isoform X2 [Dicentrarchus labrax]|uniref:tripartite motif-containing protein 16 isoform X2 n=1 Tax=Dicentrarchus labrax TaxID=13489 RepID=UPI0021F63D6F|nr:tripartite motif-containing protein 16 isoform X2 [Dicentrarchus labrax]